MRQTVTRSLVGFWLCLAFVSTVSSAPSNSIRIEIAGAQVVLPLPSGYDDALKVPELKNFIERLTPPSTRLVSAFVQSEALRAVLAGREPIFDSYFLVHASQKIRAATLPKSQFPQVQAMVKRHHTELMERVGPKVRQMFQDASRGLSRDTGTQFNIQHGESIPLGVVDETPNWISVAYLMKLDVTTESRQNAVTMLMVTSWVHLQGRLWNVNYYRTFKNWSDIEGAKQTVNLWLLSIQNQNP